MYRAFGLLQSNSDFTLDEATARLGGKFPGYNITRNGEQITVAKDDWEILRDLILAVSGQNGLYAIEDVFKQMAAAVPAFNGLNLGKIGAQGVAVLETSERIPLLEREAQRKQQGIIVG